MTYEQTARIEHTIRMLEQSGQAEQAREAVQQGITVDEIAHRLSEIWDVDEENLRAALTRIVAE